MITAAAQLHEWGASSSRERWGGLMEVKSIAFLGEHNEGKREGELRGVQRDTDENPPLRAGTDMIMGEPLVVVHHSPPPPGCCTSLSCCCCCLSCTAIKHSQNVSALFRAEIRIQHCPFVTQSTQTANPYLKSQTHNACPWEFMQVVSWGLCASL